MAKNKEAYTAIPVEEKEMEERPNLAEANRAEDELEERFDKDFWLKVESLTFVCCSCVAVLLIRASIDWQNPNKIEK